MALRLWSSAPVDVFMKYACLHGGVHGVRMPVLWVLCGRSSGREVDMFWHCTAIGAGAMQNAEHSADMTGNTGSLDTAIAATA